MIHQKVSKLTPKRVKKIILVLILFFLLFYYVKNIYRFIATKIYADKLETEIEVLKQKNLELRKKINGVYEDKEFIEKQAREQLNLVKDDEIVFIIKKE
jgi:cell division protein FtsB